MLKSSQVAAASQILQEQLQLPFKVVANEQINIFTGAHQISAITQALFTAGVKIDEIAYQRQDLETYFTDLIAAPKSEKEEKAHA